MQAGRLDRFITIENLQETEDTDDAAGDHAWVPIACNVPAQKLSPKGTEVFSSDQFSGQNQLKFRMRYRDDVTLKHRIVYNKDNYNIISIVELGRREGLDVLAEADTQAPVKAGL